MAALNGSIQVWGQTSGDWTTENPILLVDQFGRETNTGRLKIGDGVTAWNSLSYYFDVELSLKTTSNLSEGSNLYFTEARTLGTDLAGFSAVNSAIVATDTILQAFGKTQGQIDALIAGNGITSLNGLTAAVQTFAVGTSGTDFAIVSVTSTHTFNLPTASATNRGALSSTDWSTFNAKGNGTVTSVSVVAANGISGSVATATTTPAITLTLGAITPTTVNGNTLTTGTGTLTLSTFTLTVAGTSSVNGTFSGTSSGTNTGDQTITLTGEATGSGTGSFAVTLTNSAVIGKVLTGLVAGVDTPIVSTDTILVAFQNLQAQITAVESGDVDSVTGTANRITASPTTGNVIVDISASYVGQASITTLGTITTGVWNGTAIADGYLSSVYFLLAGRAGGQTGSGGTAASENLTLKSTAHATKGLIITDSALKISTITATIAAVDILQTIANNSSGTPAVGYGSGILFNLKSDTINDRNAARLSTAWTVAADGTRQSIFSIATVQSAGGSVLYDKFKIEPNGTTSTKFVFDTENVVGTNSLDFRWGGVDRVRLVVGNEISWESANAAHFFSWWPGTGGTQILCVKTTGVGIKNTNVANALAVYAPTTADALADVLFSTSTTTQKGLLIQGKASQTASLFETQSSIGTFLFGITGAGLIKYVDGNQAAGKVLTSDVNGVGTWQAASGDGTVTSVSVVTNQGVSGSVATATTTPAITLTLGALTGVTSINGLIITANTGVITTGTWSGTVILATKGGTGFGSYVVGDTLYADTTTTLGKLAIGSAGQVLTVAGGVPSWATPTTGTVTGTGSANVGTMWTAASVIGNGTWAYNTNDWYPVTDGANLGKTGTNRIGTIYMASTIDYVTNMNFSVSNVNQFVIGSTGIVTTGAWGATVIAGQYGGTGVANTGFTITVAGNLATTGAFNTTFAAVATATYTLPASTSTLASLTLAEAFTNKSYNGMTLTSTTGTFTLTAAKTFTVTNTLTYSGTDGSTLNIGTGGTLGTNAYTSTAYAPIASPTFTGTVTIPTPFTLGAVSVTTTGTQLNYLNAATGTTGTTSSNLVFSTSPTFITPILGAAIATSINALGIATGSVGKTLSVNNTLTFSGTDSSSVAFGAGGTVAYTGGTLAQFAATTSAQLAGVISDETGSGELVFGTAPTITGGAITALTSFGIRSTGAAFDLKIAATEAFSADRTLTIILNNAARTIDLGGNITTSKSLTTTGLFNITLAATNTTSVTLPLTGVLATLSGSESFANKTLGQTNTLNLLDTLFTITDNADVSKDFRFETSTIPTVTSITLSIPSVDGTLVVSNTTTTDNYIVRFDGTTGKLIQGGSTAVLTDAGLLGLNITPVGWLTIAAGTTTVPPIQLTAGTNTTVVKAGAIELDATNFYSMPNVTSGRGCSPSIYLSVASADLTGNDSATAQNVFTAAQNSFVIQASTTYAFEAHYYISRAAGTTSHTIGVAFAGTSTFTNIDFLAETTSTTGNALGAQSAIVVKVATNTAVTAASTVATEYVTIKLKGYMRINGGGTLIPQVKYSAAPGGVPTFERGTFFRLYPVGTDTVTENGAWT